MWILTEPKELVGICQALHVPENGKDHGSCDCGQCVCDKGWFGDACQYQKVCNLSKKKSNELCRNPQGVICSNAGHGKCYCGNCYCVAGWHGDKCEFQCDISPWESKKRCTSPDGKICSNRGTCICGECTCYDVDPTGEWGDVHGDTCECDERNCHSTYDRYADDFCSGKCQCGQCTCFPPGDKRVHGKNCECDDRQCEDINGETCGGPPYSHLRATAPEDHTALGSLQAGPQVPSQSTGVAGAR
ncbi:UNVERIFIED_CONTAM: hypothetical protein FKN15_052148 [Acipenser sinensis]